MIRHNPDDSENRVINPRVVRRVLRSGGAESAAVLANAILSVHPVTQGVHVHGKDHHYPAEIYAVIGRAVSELIASGKALDKKSVLLTLHAHSEQASESRLKDIYQQAFRYLLESFH